MKRFIKEVKPYCNLFIDDKTGVAWIENGSTGMGHSVHPNIDDSGSVKGMKQCGYWNKEDKTTIQLNGFNIDTVWENIIVQIGSIQIESGNTLDEQISVDEKRQKLQKEIDRLEKQARAEKQPKKKFELVQEIKLIQNKLEDTTND